VYRWWIDYQENEEWIVKSRVFSHPPRDSKGH
jgi:hypothetical protein